MLPEIALVRKSIRELWDRKFRAYTFTDAEDPDTHITTTQLKEIEGGPWPCRISRKNALPASVPTNAAPASVLQEITLICAEDIDIPAGASIRVWKNGEEENRALRFKAAGVPFKYLYHQEVELEQEEEHP